MDWLNRLNEAVDYIENHLTEEIDNDELAKIVCCSTYHFTRMFSFMSGITLMEYIRRRRLTKAALELQNSDIKVLDVSIKYCYNSPTAFNRAFQNLHGVSPSMAKRQGVRLKSYPKISFHISIKGDVNMNYRIEKRETFNIVGIKENMATVNGNEDFNRIGEMWAQLTDVQAGEILGLSNGKMEGLIGVSDNNDCENFDYYIATTTDCNEAVGLSVLTIPATQWAIFECIGALPESIIDTWKSIFTEWFPLSGYETSTTPCLEVYSDGDMNSSDYKCEIWVPIIRS